MMDVRLPKKTQGIQRVPDRLGFPVYLYYVASMSWEIRQFVASIRAKQLTLRTNICSHR